MLGKRSEMGSLWLQKIDYKREINYYGNTCSLEIDVQDRKIKMTIASAFDTNVLKNLNLIHDRAGSKIRMLATKVGLQELSP